MNFEEIKLLLTGIDDPVLKLETLMDIGKTLPRIPDGKTGAEIKGCASRVEIYRDADGKLYGAADSAMVRGIVATLIAIKAAGADFAEFESLGLNLGAGRMNGAGAVIAYLKTF